VTTLRHLLGRIVCFIARGHRWKRKSIREPGVITLVPACTRCGALDFTRAEQRIFNRAGKRKTKRVARRAIRALRR
jgi:hypothetical protein